MPDTKPTVFEVLDDLDELGSADAIAAYLFEQGIRGIPNEPCACPIARLLQRDTGEPRITTFNGSTWFRGSLQADHPLSVRVFISAFDNGQYQNLIEREPTDDAG